MNLRAALAVLAIAGCSHKHSAAIPPAPTPVTFLPLARSTPIGTVKVSNQTANLLDVTFTDAKGTTLRSLARGQSTRVTMVQGTGHVKAVSRADQSVVIDQDVQVASDAVAGSPLLLQARASVKVLPVTTSNGGSANGDFLCGADKSANAYARNDRSGETFFRFTCNDPASPAPLTHDFTFTYNTADLDPSILPEPVNGCVAAFSEYQSHATRQAFLVRPQGTTVFCGSAASTGALDAGYNAAAATGLPFLPDLTHGFFPQPNTAKTPTDDTQVTINVVHYHPETGPDVHDQYTSYDGEDLVFSGTTVNQLQLLVDVQTDDAPQEIPSFQIQYGTGQAVIDAGVSCAGVDTISLFKSAIVPNTLTEVAGAEFEGTITQQLTGLAGPAYLFARVVPLGLDGKCIGAPSSWVILHISADDPTADTQNALAAYAQKEEAAEKAAAAKIGYHVTAIQSYLPPVYSPRGDNAYRRIVITKSDTPDGLPVGCSYLAPDPLPGPPWYVNAWNEILSALGALAVAFDDIKSFVINLVAATVPGCSSSPVCKGALNAGLDIGLAALGIPPELPNLDTLVHDGGDFLAGAITDAVTDATGLPIPDGVAQAGTNAMVSQIQGALVPAATDKYDPYTWGRPDPWYGLYPAIVYVTVSRDADATKTDGRGLTIDSLAADGTTEIWQRKTLTIPTMAPGASRTFPVLLAEKVPTNESTEDQDVNDGYAFYDWYENTFQAGAAPVTISAGTSGGTVSITTTTGQQVGTKGQVVPAPACP